MLWDPKWEVKATPDIYSLAGLIAWLETKPPSQEYNWYDIDGCLLCQYLQEVGGIKRPAQEMGLGPETISDWGEEGYYDICQTQPWTFGAALERARALR